MLYKHKTHTRKTHSCVPTPSRTNRFKIIILLAFAPFLSWYAKQSVNNPWLTRNSFYFNENSIVLFQESNNKRTDEFRISINNIQKQTTDVYGWKIYARNWGVSVVCGDTNIVFADKNFEKSSNAPIFCDILVSVAESKEKLNDERLFFRPKITIWYAGNSESMSVKNIYIPKPNDKFRVIKQRDRFVILPIK